MPKYTFYREIEESAFCDVEAESPEEALRRFNTTKEWKHSGGTLIWKSADSGDKETVLALGKDDPYEFDDDEGNAFDPCGFSLIDDEEDEA